MAGQVGLVELQNPILLTINMERDMNNNRQNYEGYLIGEFSTQIDTLMSQKDEMFRLTCRHVAFGYAMYKNALARSGKKRFKPAVRRFAPFQQLPEDKQEKIIKEMPYITKIYEGWSDIVKWCTRPHVTNLDIRGFPLWKLSRCANENFVEDENNKGSQVKRRPINRDYEIHLVDDFINNIPGSTDVLLSRANGDPDQINLISKDVRRLLLRKAEFNEVTNV